MMQRLACEFMRAVRGERSQVAFSRRLGFRSNVAAEWEAGRRVPSTSTALSACARAGLDVTAAFEKFHRESAALVKVRGKGKAQSVDAQDVARWLRAHRAHIRASELAVRVRMSEAKLSRIFSGKTQVDLVDFFALVSAMTARLTDLIAGLVDVRQLPSAARTHAELEASRALAFSDPWTSAVLALLETTAYRTTELPAAEFLARRLGLDESAAADALKSLKRAGLIRSRRGRWEVRGGLTIDTRGHTEATRQLRRHWAQVGAQRLAAPGGRDLFAYNVFAASRADFERIRELLQECFREVRSIVGASEPSECAALLSLHLVDWDYERERP
jgi:transcriptional regulator with XRE-family HTH domain